MFLDRDGVLNQAIVRQGKPYPPASLAEIVIAEGAARALERLREHGFLLIVVTNQPDVSRGKVSKEDVNEIHRYLAQNLPLDEFFVCWHDDEDDCSCRKPKPGLLVDAAQRYGIALEHSYLVGDRWRDVGAGAAAGCRTILIDHGYNEPLPETPPDICVHTISEAVDRILEEAQ